MRTPETICTPGGKAVLYPEAPSWNGLRTAAIGQFRIETDAGAAAVLAQACARAEALGAAALIGPMDGDTWHSYRLVTESDGSAPFLMEPVLGDAALAAFTESGFTPIEAYFSARLDLSTRLDHAAPPEGIDLAPWHGQNADALFAEIHALSERCFATNAFYQSLPLQQFLELYRPLVPVIRPDLLFLARDGAGALRGYLFGIPNYADGPQPEAAILKTYASEAPGLGRAMAAHFHAAARDAGFRTAIHALIHDANQSGARSALLGATVFRHYAVMGRILEETPGHGGGRKMPGGQSGNGWDG